MPTPSTTNACWCLLLIFQRSRSTTEHSSESISIRPAQSGLGWIRTVASWPPRDSGCGLRSLHTHIAQVPASDERLGDKSGIQTSLLARYVLGPPAYTDFTCTGCGWVHPSSSPTSSS